MTIDSMEAKVHRHPGTTVIELSGEINAFAKASLEATYAEAAREQAERLLLDFERVTYINSTGIALIVGIMAQARSAHQEVLASGLTDHYLEIFTICRLTDFMRIYPGQESALKEASPTQEEKE